MDTITYIRANQMFRTYRVWVEGRDIGSKPVGTVTRLRSHKWQAYPLGTMLPPPAFPTRKAAGEWLAAASGLWLVKP